MEPRDVSRWEELYRLSTRFYPRVESISMPGGLPVTFVNGHHFSVPHWIKRSLETSLGTLIHFDTHADMDKVPRPDDVRIAVADLRAGKRLRQSWHIIAHAVYRNSMPVTGAVLAAGVREIVWVKPAWVNSIPDIFSRAFFYARPVGLADSRPLGNPDAKSPWHFESLYRTQVKDFFQLYYDPADNRGSLLPEREGIAVPWKQVPNERRPHPRHFERVHRVRLSIMTADPNLWDPAELVEVTGKRFILDVDLDYFVNTGGPAMEVSDNPASFGQRVLQLDHAESLLETHREEQMKALGIAAERGLLRLRLDRFRRTLEALRDAGKTPTIISFADSSSVPFSTRPDGEEADNFVPAHQTYWLREQLSDLVKAVFGAGARAAGPHRPSRTRRAARARAPVGKRRLAQIEVALFRLAAWAGDMLARSEQPQPEHLDILDRVARHGPSADLRSAARAVAWYHAVHTLDPVRAKASYAPAKAEALARLRLLSLAARLGALEAVVALPGTRWLASQLGGAIAPTAATNPKEKRRGRAAGAREPPSPRLEPLTRTLARQAPDGGFGSSDLDAKVRAALSLQAATTIIGSAARAAPAPTDRRRIWPGYALKRIHVERAIGRALAYFAARPQGTDARAAMDSARRWHRLAQLRAPLFVGRLARVWRCLPANRWKWNDTLPLAKNHEDLSRIWEAASVRSACGNDVLPVHAAVRQRVAGLTTRSGNDAVERLRMKTDALLMRPIGSSVANRATNGTDLPPSPYDQQKSTAYLVALGRLLLAERAHGVANPANRAREKRLLAEWLQPVRLSRNPDTMGAWLIAHHLLGGALRSSAARDLVWEMVHAQYKNGSWKADSDRTATTVRGLVALALVLERL